MPLFVWTRFARAYLLVSISINVAVIALDFLLGFDVGSGVSAVAPLIAAMFEGNKYYAAHGSAAPQGTQWPAAFKMALITVAISAVMIAVLFPLLGLPLVIIPIVLLATLIIGVPLCRLGFALGISNARKAAERRS